MADPKEPKSKAQRALEAKAKYETLIAEARQEEVDAITQAIKNLAEMGSTYHFLTDEEYQTLISVPRTGSQTSHSASRKAKAVSKPSAGAETYNPAKHCPVCNIDGHDARKHRSQGENKVPFTPEQLTEMGLTA